MNKAQFEALGRHDPVEQHKWIIKRDKELKKLWQCSCGKQLPTKALIWKKRWDDFRYTHRLGDDPEDSGFYCDVCTAAREMGVDY